MLTGEKSWHATHHQPIITKKPGLLVFVTERPRNLDNVSKQCSQDELFTLFQINLPAPRRSCFLSLLALYREWKLQLKGNRLPHCFLIERVQNSTRELQTTLPGVKALQIFRTLQPPHLARTQSVQQQPKKKKIHSIKMRPDTYVKKHFKHLSGSNCKSRNMNNQDNRPPLEHD
ncbi:mCG16609, isoform CRA_a [Mus musculus]|nr:mCG16609, isoform CRA_a [Mus musculus]